MQIFHKKGQIPAISKKRKPSEVRHGRKNAYFWKIQKGGPRGPPWASKSKKANDFDQPKKNGTAFKKVGQKRSKINLGGQIWEFFSKKKSTPGECPQGPLCEIWKS